MMPVAPPAVVLPFAPPAMLTTDDPPPVVEVYFENGLTFNVRSGAGAGDGEKSSASRDPLGCIVQRLPPPAEMGVPPPVTRSDASSSIGCFNILLNVAHFNKWSSSFAQ